MKVEVRPAPDAAPAEGFLALPPAVYVADPGWIPEVPAEVAGAFSAHNPWFAGGGTAATFTVPGVCRAAAFHQPGALIAGAPAAFFGYFETVGDAAAEAALLGAVEGWARDRGARALYGPINFATVVAYRVLLAVEPGGTPFVGEPWTPLGYGARLEACGYALHLRYLTQLVAPEAMRASREARRPILERLVAAGFRFEAVTPALWLARLREIHGLVDVIFGANFGYTPMSYAAFAAHAGPRFAARFCPETSVVCWAPDGAIAGIFLVFPDWGPLVCQGAGAGRLAVGALDAATHFARLRERGPARAVLKTVGVDPRYQQRGVFAGMVVWLMDRCEGRYHEYLGALIREDNASRRFFEPYPHRLRWYGLYAKELA